MRWAPTGMGRHASAAAQIVTQWWSLITLVLACASGSSTFPRSLDAEASTFGAECSAWQHLRAGAARDPSLDAAAWGPRSPHSVCNKSTPLAFPPEPGCTSTPRMQHDFPIVVGGLPGSSTRGIAKVLKDAGVFIGHLDKRPGRTRCPTTARSLYQPPFPWNPEYDWTRGREPDMSRKLLLALRGRTDYGLREVAPALRREVTGVMCESYALLTRTMRACYAEAVTIAAGRPCERAASVVPIAHGWKHGLAMLMLPTLDAMFEDRYLFVHIVRDGRDMAFSLNRAAAKKWHHLCGPDVAPPRAGACRLPKAQRKGFANPKQQLIVWAVANLAVTTYARRVLGDRYTVVRAEDLVRADLSGRRAALARLFTRLRISSAVPLDSLGSIFERDLGLGNVRHHAVEASANRSAVYSGRWRAHGDACARELLSLPAVCDGLHEYGYMDRSACRRAALPVPVRGLIAVSLGATYPG